MVLVLVVGALGLWAWSFAADKDGSDKDSAQHEATVRAASDTVRVMTANIRFSEPEDGENAWPNRRDFLVKTVLKQGPDIIGFQEVTPGQGAFLIRELAKWYSYYPRAGIGKIAAEEKSAASELLGAVKQSFASLNTLFYRADRFDCIDGEAGLVIPGQLQRDPAENTFYTLAVLKEKAPGGKTCIVVNTHLRHDENFAVKCATVIREKIAAQLKAHPAARVIVMGDMNHDRRSRVYTAIVGAENTPDGLGALADSFDYSRKRPNEKWGNWHNFTGTPPRDPAENTFYTLAVLKEKAPGGKTCIVVNTHLRHDENFAVKCATVIREKIAAQLKAHPAARVIVMGDMNHDRRSRVYTAIVGAENTPDGLGALADSFDYSRKRPNEKWGNWHNFTGTPPRDLPTDLIFSAGLKARSIDFVRDKDARGRYPSDHFFVVTDLVAK